MEKKTSVTLKLIVSFFLISFVLFALMYLYIVLIKVRWAGGNINYNKVGLIAALLFFIRAMPAILIISLHIAFSGYIGNSEKKISSIIVKPLIFTLFVVTTYASYTIYFLSPIYNQIDVELSRIEYVRLLDYRTKLKNEAIENARDALKNNNIDEAYKYLSDAQFYYPNNTEINLTLKNINYDKLIRDENIERNILLNISKSLDTAIGAYTKKNYKEAYRLFVNILRIDPNNKLAIYYMNRINEADKSLPIYNGRNIESIYIYDKLSDAIYDYENNNTWGAYKKIDELYKIKPTDLEIKSYYDIIISNVRREDFFIEDAKKIRTMYIEREIDDRLGSKNGFNLVIGEDNILNIGSALYYNEEFYMFDISDIHLNQNIHDVKITRYKYGKLLDTSDSENKNRKTFILKAKYDEATKTYSTNNEVSYTNISIKISDNTLYNIRTKRYITPEYESIYGLYKLRAELPLVGYNLYKLDNEIIKKILDIQYLFTLCIIVMFYSLKYRTKKNKRKHIFHSFIGIFGILFVLFLMQVEFLKIVDYLVPLMNTKITSTIMTFPSTLLFIVYMNKLFKMKNDV